MRIEGTGCCLLDRIFPQVDFSSETFRLLGSQSGEIGALEPGGLVFADDAEQWARRSGRASLAEILAELGCSSPAVENIGGPSIVSLIHASQMLECDDVMVSFRGALGDDEEGRRLRTLLSRTNLELSNLKTCRGRTPSTYVLSDPSWDGCRGERCFINDTGTASSFSPSDLGSGFTQADIVAFGGTALVPAIHRALPELLIEAKGYGALTIVNTVFDFFAERRFPGRAWPLGGSAPGPGPVESYSSCDLLIMDRDEALHLSGGRDLDAAIAFFAASGVGSFVITRGGEDIIVWAGRGPFAAFGPELMPVIEVEKNVREAGDTTGCGDAFAGGMIAAIAEQMQAGKRTALDLRDAAIWGIAAGAFTLGIVGGVYYESHPGEKRSLVAALRSRYR
jgi:sugar/nucleoside kinase (ribokinase family)